MSDKQQFRSKTKKKGEKKTVSLIYHFILSILLILSQILQNCLVKISGGPNFLTIYIYISQIYNRKKNCNKEWGFYN